MSFLVCWGGCVKHSEKIAAQLQLALSLDPNLDVRNCTGKMVDTSGYTLVSRKAHFSSYRSMTVIDG